MKDSFLLNFFGRILIEVLLIGIVVFLIQGHFENKWEPLTAAEILKKENYLNAKRDVYFEAITILNRALLNEPIWEKGRQPIDSLRNIGGKYPNDLEINSCFAKLCIFSDDQKIIKLYRSLFISQGPTAKPILDMRNLIIHIRKDLGYGDTQLAKNFKEDDYQLIITQRGKSTSNY
jgi:hypothetical protein